MCPRLSDARDGQSTTVPFSHSSQGRKGGAVPSDVLLPKPQLWADAGAFVCSGLGSGGDVSGFFSMFLCQKDASSPSKVLGAGRGVPGRAVHRRVSMSLRKPCPQARRRETGKKRAKFVRGAVGTGSRELLTPQHPEIPTSGCLQQPEPDLCWSRWSGRRVP